LIAERSIEVAGARTRCLEVEGAGPERPVMFFHGSPTDADDWVPFLQRLEGRRRCIAADMIGWGESERPAEFRATMENLVAWVEDLIGALAIERFDLVAHDWGSIALAAAGRRPQALGRIVIIDCVPLSGAYRWHWVARMWRRPLVGELLNATTTRFSTRQLLRLATPRRGTLPDVAERVHAHFDRTKRSVLELYRDADPDRLEALGRDLAKLRGPALVLWGAADPYVGAEWADRYASALGGEAVVERVTGAGHRPWLERSDLIDRVAEFME
jgi:pimeloyl-ACP methyl ester carboxylesterase